VWSVVLRKKSGVVEVKKVGEGTGAIVSEEFLMWRERKERNSKDDEGRAENNEGGKESAGAEAS
jgi:RAT1-interacting protein